jgi:predicted TPR repeat methyltransferase
MLNTRHETSVPNKYTFMSELEEKLAAWQSDPRFIAIAGANTSWEAAIAHYGLALYEAGETEQAVIAFEVACEQAPLKPINWSNLGVALSDLGRDEEAEEALQKSLALKPAQAVVHFNLAQILARQGKLAAAQAAFSEAGNDPGLAEETMLATGLMYMSHLEYEQAVEIFRAAVARFPKAAAAYANLGAALFQKADLEGAAMAYKKATFLEQNAGYRQNLSFINLLQGFIVEAHEAALAAYQQDNPDISLPDTLKRAVFFLSTYRHFKSARLAALAWVAQAPNDPEAAYLSQALASERLDRAPPEYLRQHFDDAASHYDQALLTRLQYQVPDRVEQLLAEVLGKNWQGWVLDAGCGTGLLADRLRPYATHLVGLDISPNMVDLARRKGLYDDLLVGDIAALPVLTRDKFDLIVATDALIYFGDLVIPFAAIAEALRPGGWFVLNLELMPGKHYFLMPNGRFKHAHIYLEQVRRAHFSLSEMVDVPLRVEAGYPVPGTILVFRKRS